MINKALLTLFLFSIAAHPCLAEVFRLGSGAQLLEGHSVYQAAVNINGGKGQLEISSYDANFSSVVEALKGTYKGKQFIFHGGGGMGIGLVLHGSKVTRLLVTRSDELNSMCTVFSITQTVQDYQESSRSPAYHLLKEVPAFTGSTPAFYMKDESTRMQVATATTQSSAAAVQNQMSAALASDGWEPAFPLERARVTPGAMLYVRGREVCCVSVDENRNTFTTTITLLHKEPAVQ